MAGLRFYSGLGLMVFCFHQKCTHAVKMSSRVNSRAPTQAEQKNVLDVWDSMSKWGGAGSPHAANIDMFMTCNTMSMEKTDFSFRGSIPSVENDGLAQMVDMVSKKQLRGKRTVASNPDKTREVNFGPLHLGKYMSDDSVVMTDSKLTVNGTTETDRSTVIASLAQQSRESQGSAVQTGSSPSQVYMYDDSLSMDKTVFTMNVGGAAASFLQDTDSSVMSLDTLDINMFMYGNSMDMTDTDFKMNVNKLPTSEPTTMRTAGIQGGDLTRLLFLTTSVFGDAAGDQAISHGSTKDTRELKSVWSWLKSWSSTRGGAPNSASINMHMYDNKMSMDKTAFTMNVGGGVGSNIYLNSLNASNAHESETSLQAAAMDYKVYSSKMAMQDTIFTIDVGSSLIQESEKGKLPTVGPGADINMHMYNNEMSMKDTIFTMNVGSQVSLLQNSSSLMAGEESRFERAKHGGTMNINRLNIKMYMYENHMNMKKTTFAWNIS
eukprot:TRINITY_DN304_c0_g1_i1.p1 TRINITY_DN304_c0_g1~~TRINITY_DN304_c0_g1_i1.p1  ORF type:complete len:491 (+),score=86.94 TRINITY_DN304_c0_g1_i1:63-1535(+)